MLKNMSVERCFVFSTRHHRKKNGVSLYWESRAGFWVGNEKKEEKQKGAQLTVDLHSHLIPGIDDGSKSIEWSNSEWNISSGRLLILTGKNTNSVSIKSEYSPFFKL